MGDDDANLEDLEFPDLEELELTNVEDQEEKKEETVSRGKDEAEELNHRIDLVERGIKARGLDEFYRLRTRWSWWIIGWITGLIVFNGLLAIGVGLRDLNFIQYEWFITAITVETFLQIVGMGYVAVRFLFRDPPR